MTDRYTAALAALLRRSAGLLPADRREWAEAVLAEAAEVPAGARRAAWLCGGLWLVTREVVMGKVIRVLAFAAGAVALVAIGWPGAASNSATPLNRAYVVLTVLLLAALPGAVRRRFGPARPGWAPAAARVTGYALVLVLIAAKVVKDRLGSKLGAYFVIAPGEWLLEIVLLLVIVGYLAGLFILTSERVRLARWSLPASIGLGTLTAGALYPLASFGLSIDPNGPSLGWWLLAAPVLPLAAGLTARRLAARDPRRQALNPVQQSALAAGCALAAATLLVATFTSVAIALFPHQVPLQGTPAAGGGGNGYIAGGGCETCDPVNTVIPRGLRHEYWVEISVGQAGMAPMAALMVLPLLGAGLGACCGFATSRAPGRKARGLGRSAAAQLAVALPAATLPATALPAAPWPAQGRASDADRDRVIGALTTAFVQGRLTKEELEARTGTALAAKHHADLSALTADLPGHPSPS